MDRRESNFEEIITVKRIFSRPTTVAWSAATLATVLTVSGAGCGSSGAEAAASGQGAGGSAVQVAPTSAIPPSAKWPVRVSRWFFRDAEVSGSITLPSGKQASAVRWEEANTPGDHPGCAVFPIAGSPREVSLCFELMYDVDSFGINEREMGVRGLEAYLMATLGEPCPGAAWEVRLAGAARFPEQVSSRKVESFTVRFEANPTAGCAAAPVAVSFDVSKG